MLLRLRNKHRGFKGGKGKGNKSYKAGYPSNAGNHVSISGAGEVDGREVGVETEEGGNAGVVAPPPSGLMLLLDDEGSQIPETPLLELNGNPLKKFEAGSLYGIQNVLGVSYTTPNEENTARLEGMEVVDAKNKVVGEGRPVDQ
jgi:hypothetical protein